MNSQRAPLKQSPVLPLQTAAFGLAELSPASAHRRIATWRDLGMACIQLEFINEAKRHLLTALRPEPSNPRHELR
jgi:hypothetical protein